MHAPIAMQSRQCCTCTLTFAAFEVEDADVMEARLIYYGITYTKAVVPGVNAAQLFFFDPEG